MTSEQLEKIILLMRRNGASIRTIAKCLGESKSTVGRWVKLLETSQVGQAPSDFVEVPNTELSHAGHTDHVNLETKI